MSRKPAAIHMTANRCFNMTMHGGAQLLVKISLSLPLGILTTQEILSRLLRLKSSSLAGERRRVVSFLTSSEVQSLRGEMIRDGALMKKWLAARDR